MARRKAQPAQRALGSAERLGLEVWFLAHVFPTLWKAFPSDSRPNLAAAKRDKKRGELDVIAKRWAAVRGQFSSELAPRMDAALKNTAVLLTHDSPSEKVLRDGKSALLGIAEEMRWEIEHGCAADSKADSPRKMPRSKRILDGIHAVNRHRAKVAKGRAPHFAINAILSEHLSEPPESRAVLSLARDVRKYPHLLDPESPTQADS